MVTRIHAIPDKDGLIRLSCGGDTIEIEVTLAAPADPKPAAPPPPILVNPFDNPHALLFSPDRAHGSVDVESAVAEMSRRFASAQEPDPSGILLRTHAADLHVLSRLGRLASAARPGVPVGVKFDGHQSS